MLVTVLEAVRIVAVLLSPVTPCLSERIYLQLGFTEADFEVACMKARGFFAPQFAALIHGQVTR